MRISKKFIKVLLKKYDARPLKRLGQNFLIDKSVIKKTVEAAELEPDDVVLEIGPGIGVLTQELARGVKKVIALEKDLKMIEILKETLGNLKNVEILKGDILKLDPKSYILKPYKIVANLPFYLTALVIRKFLESRQVAPGKMVLIVQKEVGQRICAKPPKMSILAISVQFYAKTEVISYVSKKSFWPQPKVNGAIIKITPIKLQRTGLCKLFFRIVKVGFSQPRKQLINNLSRLNFSSKNLTGQVKNLKANRGKVKIWLLKNKIQPTQRAETLSLKDWLKLTKSCKPR